MTYLKKALFIFLITTTIGCNDSKDKILINNNLEKFSEFEDKSRISFQKEYEYKLGVPNELFIKDSTLIVFNGDLRENYFLYNLSLKDGSISNGYLARGRAPNEIIAGMSFGVVDNLLWVYDITQNKVVSIPLGQALNENPQKEFKEATIKDQSYYKITLKSKDVLLGIGNSQSEKKVQEYSFLKEKVVHEGGDFYKTPDYLPVRAVEEAARAHIFLQPSGSKYLLAYRFTDVIEIFNEKNSIIKAIQGPDIFDLDFEEENTQNGYRLFEKEDTRFSYVGGYCTNEYIYLIYSGRSDEEGRASGNAIHLFNWDGKPIKKLELDVNVNSIAVSTDNKNLYAYDYSHGTIVSTKID